MVGKRRPSAIYLDATAKSWMCRIRRPRQRWPTLRRFDESGARATPATPAAERARQEIQYCRACATARPYRRACFHGTRALTSPGGAQEPTMTNPIRPVMLVILDGFGWREETADNAVRLARKPNFDRLVGELPARLPAHLRPRCGPAGWPDGQLRGRAPEYRRRPRGDAGAAAHRPRVADGSIAKAPALLELIEQAEGSGGTCHLMGLVSPGGVHSHQDHAAALAKILHAPASDRGARVHRWPRHAAAIGRRHIAQLRRGAARPACRSARSSAAITRWTATSAGTGSARPMPRSRKARARISPRRKP